MTVQPLRVTDWINNYETTYHATREAAEAYARPLAARHAVALGFPVLEAEEDTDGVMLAGTDGPTAPDSANREVWEPLVSIELAPADRSVLLKAT